jgi:hypothetical protein
LIEEVILFYKICKIKGLNHQTMLAYLEKCTERLIQMRNNELLLKIVIDLAETIKFKINEIDVVQEKL